MKWFKVEMPSSLLAPEHSEKKIKNGVGKRQMRNTRRQISRKFRYIGGVKDGQS